jgi:hypothetical protein
MWALKGTFIGISIFGIGAVVLMLLGSTPILAGPGHQSSTDIRSIARATIYNPWLWAAFVACIVIGLSIVRSWPGRFSPAFWIVLAVIDLVPAGILGLILVLIHRLKQVAAATNAAAK